MAVAATGRLQTKQNYGRVWRHLQRWRCHLVFDLVFLRDLVVRVVVTDFNDYLVHASPLDEALVVALGVRAFDDVLRFAVRVRTCRMVIH